MVGKMYEGGQEEFFSGNQIQLGQVPFDFVYCGAGDGILFRYSGH